MGNAKCNLTTEEQKEIFKLFDGTLTAEEEDTLRGLLPQYLFFQFAYDDNGLDIQEDRSTRHCFCTACRTGFQAVRGNWARGKLHNEPCNCPVCGARVTGKAVGKFRKYDMPSLTSWIKTAVARPAPDGGLLIEAADCRRSFNWDTLEGTIDWYPKARYYFRAAKATRSLDSACGLAQDDRGGSAAGAVQMWKQTVTSWCWAPEEVRLSWQPTETVQDPFSPNMMGQAYRGDYDVIGLADALEASDFRYCQLLPFYEYEYAAKLEEHATARWIVKYLAWYALLPQVEFAVKLGFMDAVRTLVEAGAQQKRLLDWSAATPAGFLRMDKREARLFIRAGMSFDDLKTWKKSAPGRSFDEYMRLADLAGGAEHLRRIGECAKKAGLELDKAARYIARQIEPDRQYGLATGQIIQTWKDYLDMAEELGYDMREQTVLMPKNLRERHDAAAETMGKMKSMNEMKRYKKRRRMLEKKYDFKLNGLRVLIPNSSEEIIREGQTLKHCVAGYAARHIRGSTTILFLRKARTPTRSYLTIELEEVRGRMQIKQIHGYRNEHYKSGRMPLVPARARFAWFLEPWLAWVNAGSPRDKEGQPVLSEQTKTKKEEQTA